MERRGAGRSDAVTLLVRPDGLAQRRASVRGPLAPLAASLRADLAPLMRAGPVDAPAAKALLSRDGGRCVRDGTALAFDPYSPNRHRCPACGTSYEGERHHRWWVMFRQLWLAERAVHAALLHALTGEGELARLAADILAAYAKRYASYPNRDNVLGPTRPFFSTYLESIWLLQLCVTVDFLEWAGAGADVCGAVRDRVIEPSAALIASYDEGASNRQVWNNAALLAANLLLDRQAAARRAVFGASGLVTHLETALLPDGTWYEGENYHLFAHRGLWYGVTLAEIAGIELPPDLVARFDDGFAAPLATALPDFTFPARRDSQYGVSLRQWRFADSWELGLARRDDRRLVGALWEVYERDVGRGDTGRWRSTAEVERNEPPTSLSRADLGWRSLLLARPTLPPLEPVPPRSVLLSGQGIAVLRRESGRVYVALDYGHSGGGHGHPDRLNLLLARDARRWLDDMGTGSYVDRSLHWYRSTLAHNAPLVDGRSQRRAHGALLAFDERGAVAWVSADVPPSGIAPDVRVTRTVVVMPDYVVDQVAWTSPRAVVVDLPMHVDARADGVGDWQPGVPAGGAAPEDGFSYLTDTAAAAAAAGTVVRLTTDDDGAAAWVLASDAAEWWHATAPGAPGTGPRPFYWIRIRGAAGGVTTVWSWGSAVRAVRDRDGTLVVERAQGERHEHARRARGWHVEMFAAGARSSIDLAGLRQSPPQRETPPEPRRTIAPAVVPRVAAVEPRARWLRFALGERDYRRSEETWAQAGAPLAEVSLAAVEERLEVVVNVDKQPVVFRPRGAPDPALDNEPPDIHSDGVQLYLAAPGWTEPAGWLAVPEAGSDRVRVRPVDGSRAGVPLDAAWRATEGGFEMWFAVPLSALGSGPPYHFAGDVVVNEMHPARERRRGQLVLSGGAGEFVYLLGDRQPSSRYLHFVVPNA